MNIRREFGDPCTTGAVKNQRIVGYGELTKSEDVKVAPHIMSVDDKTDWSTAADALGSLIVTTTITLCHRPMSTAAHAYSEGGYDIKRGDFIHTYHPLVVEGDLKVNRVSRQIWVTRLQTNPGHVGSYHAYFIAAYGPGPYDTGPQEDELGNEFLYDEEYMWWFDASKEDGIDSGKRYVGNYFNIDQYAYTSGGEMRRYFSMSSPFSNTYIEEDLHVRGLAEVRESFSLNNLDYGPLAIRLTWWEMF